MGDRIILNTKDSSPHSVAIVYPFGNRCDFKRDSYLQTKTFSGDFIDSHTPFLRISVTNRQEHYHKCDFGDCYQCHSINLQVATEFKSNPFLVHL